MSHFSECFWDSNLATSHGFELVVEHINKNFDILSTVINLIEHKVSSDDLHGRAQSKIAKSYMKSDKSCKNDEIVKRIADKIEKEANERILQCDRIKTEIIDRLKEFMKANYDKFKKAKTECSKSNKERKVALDSAQRSVKNLNSKIKAHETLVRKLSAADDEKNKAKINKSLVGVKSSEKDMITSISNLNLSIEAWKTTLETFCNIAEEVDLSQSTNIKTSLEALSTILTDFSETYKTIQSEYSDLAKELDPRAVVEQFIKEKTTNETLPKVAFTRQNIEAGIAEYSLDYANNLSGVEEHVPFSGSGEGGGSNRVRNHPNIKNIGHAQSTFDSDQQSENAPKSAPSGPTMSGYVIAQYDYTAQADDEMTFSYGDRIKIIFQEDEYWYMGELPDGTQGIFPITYVSPE